MRNLSYYPNLDVLRGVAALLIAIYHFGLLSGGRQLVPGGFLAVDVFFVLSGYLVTRSLMARRGLAQSGIVFGFYKNRVARLLPSLVAMIAVTVCVNSFYDLLPELRKLILMAISALTFSSNIYLYFTEVGYEAESLRSNPLLHTWSLGVEEQFYILVPLIFIFLRVLSVRQANGMIIVAIASSMTYSCYLALHNEELAYYSALSRYWQLLSGYLLAQWHSNTSRQLTEACSSSAYLYVAIFILAALPIAPAQHLLGPAQIVTLVSLCLIHQAVKRDNSSLIHRHSLPSRTLQVLGKRSYSIYLWHFPLLIFISKTSDIAGLIFFFVYAIALIFISSISYSLFEAPYLRKAKVNPITKRIGIFWLCLICILSAFSRDEVLTHAWLRFADNERIVRHGLTASRAEPWQFFDDNGCTFIYTKTRYSGSVHELEILASRLTGCLSKPTPVTLLIGDSHAMNVYEMLARSPDQANAIIGVANGNCRLHDCSVVPNYLHYAIESLIPQLRPIDQVVYHQAGGYFLTDATGNPHSDLFYQPSAERNFSEQTFREVMDQLNVIASGTAAEVYWLGPFIDNGINVKNLLQVETSFATAKGYLPDLKIQDHVIKYFEELDQILREGSQHNAFKYVSFQDFYSQDHNAFVSLDGEVCLQFRDNDHFSNCGEKFAAQLVSQLPMNQAAAAR